MAFEAAVLGLKNLTRRKLRSAFAAGGIAIGISAFVAIASLTQGVRDSIVGLFRDYRGDIVVTSHGAGGTGDSIVESAWEQEFLGIDGVAAAEPYLFKVREATLINDLSAFDAGEGDSEADQQRRGFRLTVDTQVPIVGFKPGGRLLSGFQAYPDKGSLDFSGNDALEAVVGAEVARQFFRYRRPGAADEFENYAIRDFPIMQIGGPNNRFKIIGVLENTGTFHDAAVILPIGTAQRLFHMDGTANAFALFVEHDGDKGRVLDALWTSANYRFDAVDSLDYLGRFERQFEDIQNVLWAIGLIAAAAGAVGVMNTMMSNVHERTREIGMLRAVGWDAWRVVRSITIETIAIATVGGVLGCVLGALGAHAVHEVLKPPIPQAQPPLAFAVGMGLSLILGLVGSLVPAIRAARLLPIEALRYE